MLLALPANIRPGWKRMEVANPLAYYYMATITAVKSFIVQAPERRYAIGIEFLFYSFETFSKCFTLNFVCLYLFVYSLSVFLFSLSIHLCPFLYVFYL
jgi:hypothetical protein